MHQIKITSLCYVLHNMSHWSHQLLFFQNGKKYKVTSHSLLFQTYTHPVTLSLPFFVSPHSPKIATTPKYIGPVHPNSLIFYYTTVEKLCLFMIYFAYKFYVFLANPLLLMNLSFAGCWYMACIQQ